MKIRTMITQDAEVDDQNSLRHLLFYANEIEIQGIIQTSSKFHWKGIPGAVKPEQRVEGDFHPNQESGPYDQPYRWPGTDWMMQVLDDYAQDYPNLCKNAEGYPTPDALRAVTKVGNIGYEGEIEGPTEGSELIRARILDQDERTLYLQVWGGLNTIARALKDIEDNYASSKDWEEQKKRISGKIVITACGEQDPLYRTYLAEVWPQIQFVKTLQMQSYAYPWYRMPEGESKDTLRASFMKKELLEKKSALIRGYCTWMDGHVYEGEERASQFGSNPEITREWFGANWINEEPQKYDFLSEGDSPTFLALLPFGLRTLENFSYGGIAGRYHPVQDDRNSRGIACNVWDVSKDAYTDRAGRVTEQESMWKYVADIQRDFAARVTWAAEGESAQCEHAPKLSLISTQDPVASPGTSVSIAAKASMTDPGAATIRFEIYQEASAECAKEAKLHIDGDRALVDIPLSAKEGDRIHVIVKAVTDGHYHLFAYQQVIITVEK